jgi:TolA-binding protein
MKMLQVFSKELRRMHKQVSNLMKGAEQNPEAGLFGVGAYYLKDKRFDRAKYAFNRYLVCYPAGKYAEAAEKHLKAAEQILSQGLTDGSAEDAASAGGDAEPDTETAPGETNGEAEA